MVARVDRAPAVIESGAAVPAVPAGSPIRPGSPIPAVPPGSPIPAVPAGSPIPAVPAVPPGSPIPPVRRTPRFADPRRFADPPRARRARRSVAPGGFVTPARPPVVGAGRRRGCGRHLVGLHRGQGAGDADDQDRGHRDQGAHHRHGEGLAAHGQDDAGDGRSEQARATLGPPGHDVGRGELVRRAHDGREEGRLGRPGGGHGERGERGQQIDHNGGRTDSDADGDGGERCRLEPVAVDEHPARATAVGEGSNERGEHDAGDELHEDHRRARGRAALLIGEDQQDEPDPELRRGEQGIGRTHAPERGVPERGAEDREYEMKASGHGLASASASGPGPLPVPAQPASGRRVTRGSGSAARGAEQTEHAKHALAVVSPVLPVLRVMPVMPAMPAGGQE